MKSRRPLVLMTLAALVSGCSVAPLMNPGRRLGVDRLPLDDPKAKTPADPAKTIAQYKSYLQQQQYFEEPFLVYGKQLDATMDRLGQGGSASEVPLEGIGYYYLKHVAHMGQAYVGLARAYLKAGDFARAERAAMNAVELAEARGLSNDVVVKEVEVDAWEALIEINTQRGWEGDVEAARVQRDLFLDSMLSQDGLAAYKDFMKLRSGGLAELAQRNQAIAQLNSQKSAQTANLFMAAAAGAASVASSYQEAQVRADASRQGYMSADNASLIQMSQMNRMLADNLFTMAIGGAGKWGDSLSMVHSFASPRLFQQFTNPSAGIDPTGIVRDFAKRATKLGRGNLAITRHAAALTAQTNNLEKARNSGNAEAKSAAFAAFLPAMNKLTDELRRVK